MATSGCLTVGLTGSIGSGKSEVARLFKELGAAVIDSDQLAREAVKPGSLGLQQVVELFGADVLNRDGSLNRKMVGEIVFSDAVKRKQLETILHPIIRGLHKDKMQEIIAQGNLSLVISVIPLLFESGLSYPELSKIIVVTAPKSVCIERIMKRDGCSREFAERKFDAQMSPEEKVKRADIVIENSSSLSDLKEKVGEVYKSLVADDRF
ncbi:MAG: dephospho-CoA kinase [Candidatus Dadabacteria bacterium]|nr:MAG: dephospho-CoA kinase [Candidatus Dadabacteria bacterium]